MAASSELKQASPLVSVSCTGYFDGELPEAYRVFNGRLVDRVEKLSEKLNEIISAKRG